MSVDWRPVCPFSSVFFFFFFTFNVSTLYTEDRVCVCVSVVTAAAVTFRSPGKLVFVAHKRVRGLPGAINREYARTRFPARPLLVATLSRIQASSVADVHIYNIINHIVSIVRVLVEYLQSYPTASATPRFESHTRPTFCRIRIIIIIID